MSWIGLQALTQTLNQHPANVGTAALFGSPALFFRGESASPPCRPWRKFETRGPGWDVRGRNRPRIRTRLDLAGLPLDVDHAGAWGSRSVD